MDVRMFQRIHIRYDFRGIEKSQQNKTVRVRDEEVVFALGILGMENYSEALGIHLAGYQELREREDA